MTEPYLINVTTSAVTAPVLFCKVVAETSSVAAVTAELLQLERGELQLQLQLQAMQAVFAALDACRDAVHITDHNHRIQVLRLLNGVDFTGHNHETNVLVDFILLDCIIQLS